MDGDDTRWRPLSVLWLMLISLGTFFFVINVFQINSYDIHSVVFKSNMQYIIEEHKGFLIKTNGCRIPDMNPFDQTIMKYVHNKSKLEICNKGLPPLVTSNNYTLYLMNASIDAYSIEEQKKLNCCYQAFTRVTPSKWDYDHKIKYSKKCITFNDSVLIKDEFVRVSCYYNETRIYKEFFSFIPLKNTTKRSKSFNDHLNVLIIGVDSISRLNLLRTMPKTVAYLNNISAFHFLGYNKVADNTFPNLLPALTGYSLSETKEICWFNETHFDDCPFVWKDFKKKGYATAFGEDAAWMGIFNYVKRGFGAQPTDYYYTIFNYVDENENGNRHDYNVFRCVGPKMVYKKFIDYSRDYVNVMENANVPFFGFFWASSLSHDYLNYPTVADKDYYELLNEFHTKGYLENTAVVFMSDHGMRFGDIRSTYQGMMEERLPFLYLLLPQDFLKKYPDVEVNLRTNSRRLTTHYDLHETLLDLLNYDNLTQKLASQNELHDAKKAYSLFEKIPDTRTCLTSGISEHWCTCQTSVEIDVNKPEVLNSAYYAVDYINSMLSKYEDCVNLTLSNVTSARIHTHSEHLKFKAQDYTIIFSTTPGNALFETTIRLNNVSNVHSVIGTISRITLYGNQSHCVSEFQMKLYCYCKDLL